MVQLIYRPFQQQKKILYLVDMLFLTRSPSIQGSSQKKKVKEADLAGKYFCRFWTPKFTKLAKKRHILKVTLSRKEPMRKQKTSKKKKTENTRGSFFAFSFLCMPCSMHPAFFNCTHDLCAQKVILWRGPCRSASWQTRKKFNFTKLNLRQIGL